MRRFITALGLLALTSVPLAGWAEEDEPGVVASKGPGETALARNVGLSGLADLVLWPGGVIYAGGAQVELDLSRHFGLELRISGASPEEIGIVSVMPGVRLYPLRQLLSPYISGRFGAAIVHIGESVGLPLTDLAAGIELASRGGFACHLEGGMYWVPATPFVTGHVGLGLGYRF